MTAQAHDSCLYNDVNYNIVGIKGQGLFEPWNHFERLLFATCYSYGFVMEYAIQKGTLVLQNVEKVEDRKLLEPFLGVKIAFTGGLLLGDKFDRSLHLYMGFIPAFKFEQVLEIKFDNGQVIEAIDRSQDMVLFRQEWKSSPFTYPEYVSNRPNTIEMVYKHLAEKGEPIEEWEAKWLNERFKLDYSDILPPETENPSTPEDGGTTSSTK